jgi:hypothetical protein
MQHNACGATVVQHCAICLKSMLKSRLVLVCALNVIAFAFLAKTSHEERCLGNYLPFEEPVEVRSENGVLDVDLIVDIGRYAFLKFVNFCLNV